MLRIALHIVLFGVPQLAFGDKCQDWFQKTKIQPGESCLMKCSAAPVDMGTFYCNGRCEEFCKISVKEKWLFKLSELYPGLTAEERRLASKDPKQPETEKAMDLANNRLGLLVAERVKRNNLLSDDDILSSFKEHLKKGDLIVIKKRGIK